MTGTQQCGTPQHHVTDDIGSAVNDQIYMLYLLVPLFYRIICETFTCYISVVDDNIHYAKPGNGIIIPEIIDDANKTTGSFMHPCQLFANRLTINWLLMYSNAFFAEIEGGKA